MIPVDLNAILYKVECTLSALYTISSPSSVRARELAEAALNRAEAINSIMWSTEHNQWRDYWLPSAEQPAQYGQLFAVSNFIPLWAGIVPPNDLQAARKQANDSFLQPEEVLDNVIDSIVSKIEEILLPGDYICGFLWISSMSIYSFLQEHIIISQSH